MAAGKGSRWFPGPDGAGFGAVGGDLGAAARMPGLIGGGFNPGTGLSILARAGGAG